MLKKKQIQVKTIKYSGKDVPVLVTYNGNSYLISEIVKAEENQVFYEGGTGTVWTVITNKKKTTIYQDKHNLKWHVYHEVKSNQFMDDRLVYNDDTEYLN